MADPRYTAPQRRALGWLSGQWQKCTRETSAAVNSVVLYCPDLIETRAESYGVKGGRVMLWRLTEAGLAEKSRIALRGETKE